jgi:putative FmdB family regulatory protein
MPLYEYECDACRHRFERIQKFSDPHVEVCPKCEKGPVKKLLSSPAIQFKGSGWYVTDYARKSASTDSGKTPSTESSSSSAATTAGTGSSETASKPAEKAEKTEKKA